MYIFFALIIPILGLMWAYVGIRLFGSLSDSPIYQNILLVFLIGTFCLQIWRLLVMRNPKASPKAVNTAFFMLGLICQLFFIALLKDLLGITYQNFSSLFSWLPQLQEYFQIKTSWLSLSQFYDLSFIIAGLILNIMSMKNAFKGPIVKTIPIDSGKKALKPLRVVQISDLHVGPIIQTEYVEKVVEQILNLQPDIIVATGDIADGDATKLWIHLEPFRKIQQPILYVTGNHEYYWKAAEWIRHFENVGFRFLNNQGISFNKPEHPAVWIGGVPDIQGKRFINTHQVDVKKSLEGADPDHFKILLAHQPKVCFEAEKNGYNLMMCGHTHGGQLFPFTLFVGFFNPFSKGLNQLKNLKVYVNLGTGFWGPPLRMGAQSEITLYLIQ